MSALDQRRGGVPVGHLDEISEIEASSVLYLRLWCSGPDGQAQVWTDLAHGLGERQGRAALQVFERLCGLIVEHGRRPLMRHDLNCRCVGADEAVFANFIAAAAAGERDDATLIATLLVRGDMAINLTHLAEQFGLALRRMLLRALPKHHAPIQSHQRLH